MKYTIDRRRALQVLAAGSVTGVAGCLHGTSGDDGEQNGTDGGDTTQPGSDSGPAPYPQVHVDAANTGYVETTSVPSNPGKDWEFSSDGVQVQGPIYANERLYVTLTSTDDSKEHDELAAFDPATGEVLQKEPIHCICEPTFHDGTLYLFEASLDAIEFRALSATDFSERWSKSDVLLRNVPLTVTSDTIYGYMGFDETRVRALSTADGSIEWEYDMENDIQHNVTPDVGPVAVDETQVYVAKTELRALNKTDGTEVWSVSSPAESFKDTPTLVDDTVYVVTDSEDQVLGYDIEDGAEVLNVTLEGSWAEGTLVHNDGYLFDGSEFNEKGFAIDMEAGEIAWTVDHGIGIHHSAAGDLFLSHSGGDSHLVAFHRSDGTVAWEALPDDGIMDSITLTPKVFAADGRVFANVDNRIISFF